MNNLMNMEPELLRAIIRERTHHTLEFFIDHIASGGKTPTSLGEMVKTLLTVWEERGFQMDLPDLNWSQKLLKIVEDLRSEKKHLERKELTDPFSEVEMLAVKRLIYERRSVRTLSYEKIPSDFIRKIVKAGLWAPSACNLQTTRVLVIDDEEGLTIFKGGEARGGSHRLIICYDERPYEFYKHQVPDRNRLLDCGAATQNMLLMVHSLGLGAVWITLGSNQLKAIRELYNIPEYIKIITCIAVGLPLVNPITPARMCVDDILIK